MNPRGTPRNFKVKNDVVVPPVSLVPQQAAGAALPIASTPSERIGQLYTPSASGLSPRLLATGLPPSAREVVELGSGPTMEGASAAPRRGLRRRGDAAPRMCCMVRITASCGTDAGFSIILRPSSPAPRG